MGPGLFCCPGQAETNWFFLHFLAEIYPEEHVFYDPQKQFFSLVFLKKSKNKIIS